jgi:hypothetical protein
MARGGFERTQRVQWVNSTGHGSTLVFLSLREKSSFV